MAEYYRAEQKRTSAKNFDKTPYRKIFLRQLIAAILCFLLIKHACTDDLRQKLKAMTDYNMDFSFLNEIKLNGADTNETKTTVQ